MELVNQVLWSLSFYEQAGFMYGRLGLRADGIISANYWSGYSRHCPGTLPRLSAQGEILCSSESITPQWVEGQARTIWPRAASGLWSIFSLSAPLDFRGQWPAAGRLVQRTRWIQQDGHFIESLVEGEWVGWSGEAAEGCSIVMNWSA